MSGDFVSRLPKIYGMYTGGFLAFVVILAIAEQMGLPNAWIGYVFMAATIGLYAMIGIMSRTAETDEYYVAGRRVPALYNGMATGADWMSAASFIGMAGTLYAQGYDGLAFVMGWTGGYVLVALFLAPYLRKFGQYTIPDFLGTRYGGNLPRTIGIICAITASFTYVIAQIYGAGIITSRFLGIDLATGVWVGLIGVLVCSLLGGMRAVTWTQVAQYIVLIIAYLVPVVWLSIKVTGNPVPQLAYGEVLQQITVLEQQLGVTAGHATPFVKNDIVNFMALTFCLMVGTAALPHILMRFFTTPSVKEARKSVGWSLFFIFLLYFTAPAYAAFAKLEVYSNVIGQSIATLPAWVASWTQVGLVSVCDATNAAATVKGCVANGNGDGILQLAELMLNADAIVLATPEIAGLPYVVAGLVAAGGAVDGRRPAADDLQRALARRLLQDGQPERDGEEAAHRGPHPAAGRGGDRGLRGLARTGNDPVDRGLGVLDSRSLVLPRPGAWHLLEAGEQGRRGGGHAGRLRAHAVLPDQREVPGHDAVAGHQGRVGRYLRHPAGLPHDLGRKPDDGRAVAGNQGHGRRPALPETRQVMATAAAFLPEGRGIPGAGAGCTGAFFLTGPLLTRIPGC